MNIRAVCFHASSVVAIALCGAGCAVPSHGTDVEDVDAVEGAIGSASCAAATADKVFAGVSPLFTTPRTYDNAGCNQGYVVDISRLEARYTGKGDLDAAITAEWADTVPTNKADCERTEMYAIYYFKSPEAAKGTPWRMAADARPKRGVWGTLLINGIPFCTPPRLAFTGYEPGSDERGLVPGRSYRVAGGARIVNADGTKTTRKFRVETTSPVFIR
jgi:hypothetical protein